MSAAALSRLARQGASLALLGLVAWGAASLARGARLEPADFTLNNGDEVASLDPARVTGIPEGRLLRAIFEGLVVWHPRTLEPLPGMAESWEVSADGLVYTFRIRRDARWSNGDPVTAHDFLYSFERLLSPDTGAQYGYQLWYVKGARAFTTEVDGRGRPRHSFDTVGIRAPDAHTLRIELEAPTAFFLDLMGFYPLFPVNRRNIEEARERWPDRWDAMWLRPENIVTNGPYRVAFRRVNDRIRLVKNEGYWDADRVAMRSIDILAIQQESTMLNFYLTGACDFIDRVDVQQVPALLPREDFEPAPYLGTYFYRVNVTRPPLDDARVRRALSLTIDRPLICAAVTKAGELPWYSLVPPGLPGYEPARCAPEDVARAKQLIAEAGYGPGGRAFPTIEILYNTSEVHRDLATVVASAWRKHLGIDVRLLNQEWKVYLDSQTSLDYDVARAGWIGDYADPNTFLDLFVGGGTNNKTGWSNAEYDRLIAAAARELERDERLRLLRAAEEILVAELPILPIYAYVTKNLVRPRLGGFHDNVQDVHFPKFWYWMDDAELAEKRAQLPPDQVLVQPGGPPEGLYAPAAPRARAER